MVKRMTFCLRLSATILAATLLGVAVFLWVGEEAVMAQAGAQASSVKVTPTSKRAKASIARKKSGLEASLSLQNMSLGDPVFIRILKTTPEQPSPEQPSKGRLEVFIRTASGEFEIFKTYEICTWSGQLGPKLKQGDGQSPEGFYFVKPNQMNPWSSYHLSFNLGYPNAYDRAHGRTGDFLMVHGNCVSIGCYAMTDDGIEEIYTLMDAAFEKGQPFVRVHVFPFPMSDENLKQFEGNLNAPFWKNLQEGWDWFETNKRPPNVTVGSKTYILSASGN